MSKFYRLYTGDSLEVLRGLESESVRCCVTSPPYYGLRDYNVGGQIGLEKTPEQYVQRLVEVFREVRRVLRDDGTLWLNIGDSYASGKGTCYNPGGGENSLGKNRKQNGVYPLDRGNKSILALSGLKPKDLIGIPWRVAFALQADGWYLRQDIIWVKKNCMPESVSDRCTRAHEYLFLLAKAPRYYFDADAIKEPCTEAGMARLKSQTPAKFGGANKYGGYRSRLHSGREYAENVEGTRNKRSVWTVSTSSFKDAHFAVFPPDLVRPCVLAGSRAEDVVLDPFSGSGTTGVVALSLGREYIGIDINPEYNVMAERRLERVGHQGEFDWEAADG